MKRKKATSDHASQGTRLACSTGDTLGMACRVVAAISSGLLLSASFPPLNHAWLAWISLIPLLVVPTPRRVTERFVIGFLFGYTHFATVLHWLNEVGFGAGWLLAIYCALYPMAWYMLVSWWNWRFKDAEAASRPGAGLLYTYHDWKPACSILAYTVFWVSLEYLRGHLFTGFPWDLAGVSQFRCLPLLKLVPWTGIYGISFLILLVNSSISAEISRQIGYFLYASKREFPWYLLVTALFLVPSAFLCLKPDVHAPANAEELKCVAIQGNLPQCRFWTEEDFRHSLDTYTTLSREAASHFQDADLLIWPECAIPAELEYREYQQARLRLHADVKKQFLLGALRTAPLEGDGDGEEVASFNSVFYIDKDGSILDYYDKTYRVPFGEYTPFGDQLPWLKEMIDMGRDLTPGRAYHVFSLPKGARAGVNICYEDVFPHISQKFTQGGANILMTVTNDAWYNQSCGAEQHLSHAVFRAVENRRPFLRCGNNSFSCLITPNGKILGIPVDSLDNSPFVKTYQMYNVAIYGGWGTTFFTRHGDAFGLIVLLSSAFFLMHLGIMIALGHSINKKAAGNAKK